MFYDKRLPQDYEDLLIEYGYSPHCDAAVLHFPGTCSLCDKFEALHVWREVANVNWTGCNEPSRMPIEGTLVPSKAPCWAERYRPIATIYKWVDNKPVPHQGPKAGSA